MARILIEMTPKTVWAGEILRTEEMDGTAKIDLIDERELEMVRGCYVQQTS